MHAESEKDFPALPLFCGAALGAGLTPLVSNPGMATSLLFVALLLASMSATLRRLRMPAILVGCVLTAFSTCVDSIREKELLAKIRSISPGQFVTVEGSMVDRIRCDETRCSSRFVNVEVRQNEIALRLPELIVDMPRDVSVDADVIRAEAHLRPDSEPPRATIKSGRLISPVSKSRKWHPRFWRKRIAEQLSVAKGDLRGERLVEAIALGDKDSLSNARKEQYRDAGVYHLLVFSGMQITIAAMLLLALIRSRRLPRVADWMLIALSLVAPAIAGGAPSVARASIMIGLDAFCRVLHRPTSYTNLLFFSATIRIVIAPQELLEPSFLLTYCATSGLLLIAGSFHRRTYTERFLAIAAAMIAAELLLSTITRFFFSQWTMGSSIVTLFLSPIFTLLLILAFAAIAASLVVPTLAPPLLHLIAELEEIVLRICAWLTSNFQFVHVDAPPSKWLVAGAFAAFLILLAMLPKRVRCLAALPLLITHLHLGSKTTDAFFVKAFDVGQGDAVLLRSPSGTVLIDSGPPPYGIGLPLSMKRLAASRVAELDALVLTHAHPDHCGGAVSILRYLRVAQLIVPRRQLTEPCLLSASMEAARRGTRLILVEREESVRSGSVEVSAPRFRFKASRLNNESLITRAVIGREVIFLAGDIEKDGERFWINELPPSRLRSSILKLAHHGSITSSTESFLESIQPEVALVTVGRRNLFGHPHPEVIARLRQHGVRIERTDASGDVTIEIGPRFRRTASQFDSPF